MTPWLSAEEANTLGAVGGATIGVLGGVIGVLVGTLGRRGKAKPLVLGVHLLGLAVGVVALGAVGLALLLGQPEYVWRSLIVVGAVGTGVLGGLLPMTFRAYRESDARKLESQEMRRAL